METYPMNPSRERRLVTDIECHFRTIQLRVLKKFQIYGLDVVSDAHFAWLLVQGAFGIHHVALHRSLLF